MVRFSRQGVDLLLSICVNFLVAGSRWTSVDQDVRNLRQRIFVASKEHDLKRAGNLQKFRAGLLERECCESSTLHSEGSPYPANCLVGTAGVIA